MKLRALLLLLVLSVSSFSQIKDEDIIATVGDVKITVEEFKTRYQMRPIQNSMLTKNEESTRAKILYSIIAEKLWALEASSENYDTTDVMNLTYKSLEKSFLRDALYQKEIAAKVQINDIDYIRAVQKSKLTLQVNYIVALNKTEADSIYSLIKKGKLFDEILSNRREKEFQKFPLEVNYGDLPVEIEDSLYALEIGEFTKPLKTDEQWYIYKIITKDFANEMDSRIASENKKKVRSILEARATDEVFLQFYSDFFKGKEVSTDGYLFWTFADNVIKTLNRNREEKNLKPNDKIVLESSDLIKIATGIGLDSLNMTFINLENNKITLKEYLYDFVFEGFYTTTNNPNILRGQLNSRVKRFIELELLYQEAKKQGFYNDGQVQKDIAMWKPYYQSTLLRNDFKNTINISETELEDYYNALYDTSKSFTMINIIEVLSDSLEVIENAMQISQDDNSLRNYVKQFTKREWVKKNNGEFGLFPSSAYGEIGRIASTLEIGETYGPLKTDEGYSFFKLIERQNNQELKPQKFEELKDELRKQLIYQKSLDAVVDQTVGYANKYGVNIKYDVLYNLDVKNLNMLVYRYMGFGGRILAIPLTPVFSEWVQKWQHQKESL